MSLVIMIKLAWGRKIYDFVFGYDYFVSYRWADGRLYAEQLVDGIGSQFKCFLDTREFHKGLSWRIEGKRALKKTAVLILVSTPKLYTRQTRQEDPVKEEIEYFAARHPEGRIIVIDIGQSFEKADSTFPIKTLIGNERIRIAEKTSAITDGPSNDTIKELKADFDLATQVQKRLRILMIAIGLIATLAVVTSIFFWKANREKQKSIENYATTLLNQAGNHIDNKRFNEAAAYLSEGISVLPDAIAAPIWLRSLLQEVSYFKRTEMKGSKTSEGRLWDAVFHDARQDLVYVIEEGRTLKVLGGQSAKLIGLFDLPEKTSVVEYVKLSPKHDRLLIKVMNKDSDDEVLQEVTASYQLNKGGRYQFEAMLPNDIRDAVFLKNGALILGTDSKLSFYRLEQVNQMPQWQTFRQKLPIIPKELLKKFKDDALTLNMLEQLALSPSEKLLFVVVSLREYRELSEAVYGLNLDTLQHIGNPIELYDRLWSIDSITTKDSIELLALAWDGRYRNKARGGLVQIYEIDNGQLRKARHDDIENDEGINTVAFLNKDLVLVGTDASRVHVYNIYDWKRQTDWFSVITRGAIQKVVPSNNDGFWVLKTESIIWDSQDWSATSRVAYELWKPKNASIIPAMASANLPNQPAPTVELFLQEDLNLMHIHLPNSKCKVEVEVEDLKLSLKCGGEQEESVDMRRFRPHIPTHKPNCMAVSSEGDFVAIGGGEDPRNDPAGYAVVWSINELRPISPMMIHRGAVVAVYLAQNGKLLATLSRDFPPQEGPPTHLQIWDVKTGHSLYGPTELQVLFGLEEYELIEYDEIKMAFSTDTRSLFFEVRLSGDQEKTSYELVIASPNDEASLEQIKLNAAAAAGLQIQESGMIEMINQNF